MFSIYPGLPATGFTKETSPQQVIYRAQRIDAPASLNQGETEGAVFTGAYRSAIPAFRSGGG